MSQLTFDIEGARDLKARLSNSPQLLHAASRETLETATLIAEGAAKENAPIDKGLLRGSLHSEIQDQGLEMVGIVGTNLEYAPYQEFGTGLYGPNATPITPKQSKFLAWRAKSGDWVFARSVAGSRPRRFMAKGLQEVRVNMNRIREKACQAVKSRLGF